MLSRSVGEPGLRSVDRARELIEAVGKWSSRLTVENRIQLRWETFCLEGIPLLEEALEGPLMPSLAFNDHTSMAMLHPDMPMQKRPFEHSLQFPVVDMQHPNFRSKLAGRAERSGLTPAEYASLLEERWQMRSRVKEAIAQVGQMGRRNNVPMLSHDDTQDENTRFLPIATARPFANFLWRFLLQPWRRKGRHGGVWRTRMRCAAVAIWGDSPMPVTWWRLACATFWPRTIIIRPCWPLSHGWMRTKGQIVSSSGNSSPPIRQGHEA